MELNLYLTWDSSNSKLALYRQELTDHNMVQFLVCVKHPQTSDKIEGFFGTLKAELVHLGEMSEFRVTTMGIDCIFHYTLMDQTPG